MRLLDRAEHYSLAPILDGLDAIRQRMLKRGAGFFAPFVRDRDKRIIAVAIVTCVTALAGTALAPGYMLLLGPIVLGVPHLFFESRYLFFQHDRLRRSALVGVLLAQTVCVFAGIGIYTLGIATIAGLLVTGRIDERRAALLVGLAVLTQIAALVGPDWSRFALLHVHNCVPLAVWLMWRRRPAAVSIAVVALFAACVALIFTGCFDALSLRRPAADDVFSLTRITDAVAAGFGGEWRHRFLLFFCFTQAVHYALWLRMIPEEARARATPRSWRASWRAFKQDSGRGVAWLTVGASIAIPLVALIGGMVRTRALYVTASEFHATVEVILVAAVFARR